MKKIISILALLLCCALAFTACDTPVIPEPDYSEVMTTLNTLIAKDVSAFDLNVTTRNGNNTLKSTYLVTSEGELVNVSFSYEVMNKFTEIDGVFYPPSEEKSTLEGKIVLKDGEILSEEGEPLDADIETLTFSGITFDAKYFDGIKVSGGVFEAKVTDAVSFLGRDVSSADMSVRVHYSDAGISKITLKYNTPSGSDIEIVYDIKK